MISLEWAEPVSSVLNVVKLLTIDLEILRFNCVAALSMPARYFWKFTMIFVLLAAMAAVHTGFVITRHMSQFNGRMPTLIRAIGSLFMASFISLVMIILEPLQCLLHPNGEWTLRPYPTVVCWNSADHKKDGN